MKNTGRKPSFAINPKIVACIIILMLLIPAMFISSYIIDNELMHNTKETLSELSAQNVKSINDAVEADMRLLEELSDRISNDISVDYTMGDMSRAAEAYGFKRMGIVRGDGTAFASDGAQLYIAQEDHIVRAFSGQRVISDIFRDMADDKLIFVYAVPVYDDSGEKTSEHVKSVMFATCDTTSFQHHLSASAFGGREYSYIVKSDGTTVINSDHRYAYKNMGDVFVALNNVGNNDKAAEELKNGMASHGRGCFSFTNLGSEKYLNYEPLGINDWYILSVVPTDVTDGSRFRIMRVVYTVFAAITVAAAIFVIVMIRAERAKRTELKRILYVDDLTGGISFTKFCIDAVQIMERNADRGENSACVMVDLDNFRLINNLYGKAEGDRAILNSYRALRSTVSEEDLLTRRIADRFYALISFKEKSELDAALENLIHEIKTAGEETESEYIINPSMGVYIPESPYEDIETITNNATIAHDTIGSCGARIAFYDEAQRDRMTTNKLLEDKMELAHKNHEFIPYFQPKYDALSGKICGAEALIRWKNPDGSVTPPGKFIPLAESNGFIRVLDRDIFNAVCAFQKKVQESVLSCVPVSVNVSRQLMYEQNFAADYIATIKEYGLSPDLIELEITESVLFDDYSVFRDIINTLREGGFKILMDDFGTGYSSLMMLSSIPIDNLKLDKSFIDSFGEDKGRKIIVCVIELAKSLSLPLTAEGVETQEQYDFLKSMGCEVIQGYYFSKPVPEERFIEMLSKN